MEDCPLCAHSVEELRYPEEPWIVEEVQARFPDWNPGMGLCSSCLREIDNPFQP